MDIEVLHFDPDEVWLVRREGSPRRRLRVTVDQPRRRWRLEFPAAERQLTLRGPRRELGYGVEVRPAHPLRRLVTPARRIAVEPHGALRCVITGSGRCGTTSVARYLDGLRLADGTTVQARHESAAPVLLEAFAAGDRDHVASVLSAFTHHVESAAYFALMPELLRDIPVVQLIRDGRQVVRSGYARGWFQDDRAWNRIKPEVPGSPFERCCHFWVHMNRNAAGPARHLARLEDLATRDEARQGLLAFLGIEPSRRSFPTANRGQHTAAVRDWTAEQHAIFARVCGPLMDRYYPGWR